MPVSAADKHVSVVVATHNRCEVALRTLHRVREVADTLGSIEMIVVDNASTDGTAAAARGVADRVIELRRNRGSCAKAFGVEQARGRYILFLDDDSCPRPGAIEQMIRLFEQQPRLASAGFCVVLPDGSPEASALPGVFVGCGVGLRAEALRQVGGLDASFFMQAEEFDLCFRLVNAGWEIGVFPELIVDHLKTATSRRTERTTFYDIRNNLRVLARYLPAPHCALYADDWLTRYRWLAEQASQSRAYLKGVRSGTLRAAYECFHFRNRRLSPPAFERLFCWEAIAQRMDALAGRGVSRIVLAGFGKNIYAFFRAARLANLRIDAIADDRFAQPGRSYRGIELMSLDRALSQAPDAVVVANMAGALAMTYEQQLRTRWEGPVLGWFGVEGLRETEVVRRTATGKQQNTHEQPIDMSDQKEIVRV